jgi:hypothetical protein
VIRPNVRASFGRREAELLVAAAGSGAEERLRELGIDALLDDAEVMRRFARGEAISAAPAPLVFYLLVRHALLAREILDRQLADYTAALLLEFGRTGRATRPTAGDAQEFGYLVDILAELEQARGEREFQLRIHLGNFALWLAGVFPGHITHRVQRRGAPPLSYYDELGAAGFRTASSMELAVRHGLGDLFLSAADHFRELRVALNGLSDALFFPASGDALERLLRVVKDDFDLGRLEG